MFLAINQNVLAAKKRKKEKQQQQQQQQILNQQQQEWQQKQNLILTTEETGETKMIAEPRAATNTANTIDKMLMELATESTAATATTKCKNCQHELPSGQQQQLRQQQQQQQLENKRKQPQQQFQVPATSLGTPATDFLHSEFHVDRNFSPPPSLLLPVECHCNCNCVHKSFVSGSGSGSCSSSSSSNSGNSAKICHNTLPSPTKKAPSLHTVYMCLAALTFALATLAILFYSHVNSVTSSTSDVEVVPFREQFRRELHASDDMLRSIVAQIMQQHRQQQLLQHEPPQQSSSSAVSVSMSDVAYETTKQHHQTPVAVAVAVAVGDDDDDVDDDGGGSSSSSTGGVSYEPLENFRYQSTTLPYDNTEIVRNERKFSRSISNGNVAGSGRVSEKQNYNAVQQRKRRDISSPSSTHDESFIEFLNPNHREVLEKQYKEIRKRDGQKGSIAAPGGKIITLDTTSRVPENVMIDFCLKTKDYCLPGPQGPPGPMGPKGLSGPPGLPGIPGPKGNRGDVGLPGAPGVDGDPGIMGPRGPKGDIGIPGRVGLDGRDGVPGEPGLDGVPGRAGADGIPGKDGDKGRDGRNGEDGKNGKDGAPGLKGAQGPPGDRGLKGIAGPRGRPGKSGTNGTPGIPGINAWKVQLLNGSFSNDLLIPPSIADANAPHIQRVVIVEEGKTLNISCGATGNPVPHVEWRRDDGRTININGAEMSSVSGQFLKFRNITRNQMAAYTCYADNGIAPVANATYLVEVQFAPMISIYRDMIYAEYGHSASLECLFEAYPEAIRYWERSYDGKILDPGEKYRIESYPDGFKTTMRLTINNLRKDDFGYYHCVARNELNATMANFEIAPQDPNSEIPYVGKDVKIFGQRPPVRECPVCEHCQETSLFHCKDSINSNFDIQPTGNYSYPGLPKRRESCLLYAIGKPVYHKLINESYASWLKDAAAKEFNREKTFLTKENDYKNLYEFQNKVEYRLNKEGSRRYEVSEGFYGNAHVVYNGSFFFHQRNTNLIVKKDLVTLKEITMELPFSGIISGNKLYSTDYNYMDFNVDDVGLWVIYSTYDSNNTMVAKLDANNLKMQYNFNITLDHRKFGEMFIVCGHLYAIDSCTDKNSQIRYVVDLYNGKLLNVDLPYSNPFRKTTTVSYNPLNVELYSLDKGNALTYPIRYHEQALDVPGNKEK